MVGPSWKNLQLEAGKNTQTLRWVNATLKSSLPLFHKATAGETWPQAAKSNTSHFQPGVIEKQLQQVTDV